jgi:hypothetical protein
MATPVSVYMAAERFVLAAAKLSPDRKDAKARQQCDRIIEDIGKLKFDQDQATELLEVLSDESDAFSEEHRTMISDLVQLVLDGDDAEATSKARHVNEGQTLLHSYNYYPAKVWAVLRSKDETDKNKMRHVAHFLVKNLQVRSLSAQSKRIIISTIHVAVAAEKDPDECYDDLNEFSKIMTQKREELKGPQSLKTLPNTPQDFMKRYPGAYHADHPPVRCPVDISEITRRANKHEMPARNTNANLSKNKKTQSNSPGAPRTDIARPGQTDFMQQVMQHQKMMLAMKAFMKNDEDAPDDMPSIGRKLFNGADENRRHHASGSASSRDDQHALDDVPRSDHTPKCVQKRATGLANLDDLKAKLKDDLAEAIASRGDGDDTKPKCHDEDVEHEEDEEDEGDVADKSVLKRPVMGYAEAIVPRRKRHKTSPPPVAAAEPVAPSSKILKKPAAALPECATVADVLVARRPLKRYPHLLAALRRKKHLAARPKPVGKPTAYAGGKIYYSTSKDQLRVYTRKRDAVEQTVSTTIADKTVFKADWGLACAMIEEDPRDVD